MLTGSFHQDSYVNSMAISIYVNTVYLGSKRFWNCHIIKIDFGEKYDDVAWRGKTENI